AAHGEADEVRLADAEAGEQAEEVVGELVQAVRARRRARLPVAPRVVAEDAVPPAQGPHLVVPHAEVAREGVAERHHRALALDLVVDVDAVGRELHRSSSVPGAGPQSPITRGRAPRKVRRPCSRLRAMTVRRLVLAGLLALTVGCAAA